VAILHVRNVSEDLYQRIKARARAEKRSLSAEVLMLLERGRSAIVSGFGDLG
jgi:plasmid stability protein